MRRIDLLGVVPLLLVATMPGCVERRFTVVSNPPGAMVLVNRQEIGAAPVILPSRASTYYGDREFLLIKDGYEPLLVKQPIPAPWYGYFPLDFVAEHLWPGTIVDERTFTFQLSPQRTVPPETVLQSATNTRQRATGIGSPLPSADSPTIAPALPPGALPAAPAVPATPPPIGSTTGQRTGVAFD